jgi:hypothetical protein
LSDRDKKALQQWTREFMLWLETSRHGKQQKRAKNNHGTFYDLTTALQAMYIDDYDRARDIIQCYMLERIPKQFRPDGSQPFEMVRLNNYNYHLFNLEAAFNIAQLADHFDGIDTWNFETEKGAGLRRSIEFLLPYLIDQWQWNYFEKRYFHMAVDIRWRLLRKASIGFADPLFEAAAESIACFTGVSINNLTHPKLALINKVRQPQKGTKRHKRQKI